MNTFLLKRPVDLSLLTDGFHIQTEMQKLVYALPGGELHHGENRTIKIMIDGEFFTAKLYNIGFDQTKYPGHPDLLQVRYSPTSPIAKKLQTIYHEDFALLTAMRNEVGKRKKIQLPDDNHDEIVFSGTAVEGVFALDCIHGEEVDSVADDVKKYNEIDFETSFEPREDSTATIKEVARLQKIRHLDRSIGDSLKQLYDFRCQMTGERIGESYDALVVEAHHIIPFTKSLNNDTSNIIILSPSYHRIIHRANPEFDRNNLQFVFPNGLKEKVKINLHL